MYVHVHCFMDPKFVDATETFLFLNGPAIILKTRLKFIVFTFCKIFELESVTTV